MIRAALLLALCSAPAFADTPRPQALKALLDYHAAACSTQGGTLAVAPDAVAEAHLSNGDQPDMLLDSSKLSCSAAPFMFCGDGVGCELNVFIGEDQHSLVVLDWSLDGDDDRQLLVVTIAGILLRKTGDLTYRMTWDPATKSLMTIVP
jgi:hypothetical protein